MKIVKTISELRAELAPFKNAGKSVGLVPTMGALHQGHASLIDASVKENDVTVVSVFVNPIQFGKTEDLDKYPRRLLEDAKLAEAHGATFIFAPEPSEMYPDGDPQTLVRNESLESLYCGAFRPGHFRGVLTVVSKLFLISGADRAYFGKKDYQQAFLIRRMVKDLNFAIEIRVVPIIREESGLARSSRNEYLTEDERKSAVSIYQGLIDAKAAYDAGQNKVQPLRDIVVKHIIACGGQVQFVELASLDTLIAIQSGSIDKEKGAVILVAAFFGKTRLIDNIELQ